MNSLSGVMVVGLTGQTGAGKSTVTDVFREAGFTVIDADRVAKFIQRCGSPCLAELKDFFSDEIISPDGNLNRAKLAEIVFSEKSNLEALNSICYPYISNEILRQIRRYARMQKKLILLDAPTLFESRTDDFCELIISVIAKENIRMSRIMQRDNISEESAKMRMKSQLSQRFFIQNSDYIIKNNGSVERLSAVATEVADKIIDYYHRVYNKE
jgi:dephospho-CoA kinase